MTKQGTKPFLQWVYISFESQSQFLGMPLLGMTL